MKKYILLFSLYFPTQGLATADLSLEARLEQLEKRVMLLEQKLNSETHREKVSANIVDKGYVHLLYWLGNQKTFPTHKSSPMVSGKFKLSKEFYFNPDTYNVANDSMFSHFDDPGRYPIVALNIEGTLLPPMEGNYQLTLKPTPPREVGGAGNVEMSIHIYVDNKLVLAQDFSSTLRPTTIQLQLPESPVGFRMEAVARSPGFGPPPTKAKIFIGLQENNSATPEPIGNYLSLPH